MEGKKCVPECPLHAGRVCNGYIGCPRFNTGFQEPETDKVNNPIHYGGADNPYEAIKVIEAWGLGFNLGNTVKYISRAGKKDDVIQDLEKARFYLDREISNLKKQNDGKNKR